MYTNKFYYLLSKDLINSKNLVRLSLLLDFSFIFSFLTRFMLSHSAYLSFCHISSLISSALSPKISSLIFFSNYFTPLIILFILLIILFRAFSLALSLFLFTISNASNLCFIFHHSISIFKFNRSVLCSTVHVVS